ncbi:Cthe_2314 family HEPN domain-containing protein [Paenibacillus spongiae]|uniref:Cthe-2314-like HEPN domain-containing protein n=1 Tax=Paenibacillus spongiae TaxID=2909671 RepID=A0ABY5SDZ9_9BACL|nr:Cthe_2314 family HEPN domain-containing protein [Paenibacillus spongiae]UVI31730.1 hypothetical protein L1F29_07910 [Paenibacillus spongiae]
MLRMIFDEQPRQAEGKLLSAMQAMERFGRMLNKRIERDSDSSHKLRKYEIWTLGLLASLDELEQSQYASQKFAAKVTSGSVDAMSSSERLDYNRYVYFDKNAFIRLFSILDKLGTLLNDVLELQTERFKAHFSYFTVLRNMRQRNAHPELMLALNELKERYKEPMGRLRKRRNTEVHYMNSEMQDDLMQSHTAYGSGYRLENLQAQSEDLRQGMDLVMESLRLSFEYAERRMRKRL